VTRRDRIVVLLEHYNDVQPGLVDTDGGDGSGGGGLLADGCWKHYSYRELERLLGVMRDTSRATYWHLAETYFWAPRRRVAYCPSCRRSSPTSKIDTFHKHGHGRTFKLVPKAERMVSPRVRPKIVALAIDWLESNWNGEPLIPDDLLGVAAEHVLPRATLARISVVPRAP